MVASIDMAETNYIFYGGCESINSLHSNISIYSLNTLLYTFSLVLTREICLTIKAPIIGWRPFPLLSRSY